MMCVLLNGCSANAKSVQAAVHIIFSLSLSLEDKLK